jgi:quercetin dioxygenase-like cupin family protein
MIIPFDTAEQYPDGMTVQEVGFPVSTTPTAPFRATRIVVKAGGRSPVDRHAVTECWFAASGTATIQLGDDSFTLMPGNVVGIAPHIPHQAINDTDQDFVFYSLWWNATDLAQK